jgi:hypothetical protein
MCGTEYGGGGGGERRWLYNNALDGEISTEMELGNLSSLELLCVRPAPPPHLAMWGQLREARWVGKQVHGCCGLTPEEGELLVS